MNRVPRATVRDVERELERLEHDRDELDRAIARLRQVAVWLRGRARGNRASVPQSLTSACRAALRTSPEGLTPPEVKRALSLHGFDWKGFTNPMSAVHTVLKRLVKQNEASSSVSDDGKRRFRWNRREWPQWPTSTPSQAAEAARIEHLLDGSVSETEFAELLKSWQAARIAAGSKTPSSAKPTSGHSASARLRARR